MDLSTWGATEYAAVGTYLAILVGGAVAVAQLVQMQQAQRQQIRPYVTVDFDFQGIFVYLVVRNIGATMAKAVTIRFDPELDSSLPDVPRIDQSPLFREPIPMVAPGREIRVLFDSYATRLERTDLPMEYHVRVDYYDSSGKSLEDPEYPLDLAMYLGSELPRKGLNELVEEVAKLRTELGKWRYGTRGLLVYGVDERRHVGRRSRPTWRRIAAGVRRDKGLVAYGRWLIDKGLRTYGWRR